MEALADEPPIETPYGGDRGLHTCVGEAEYDDLIAAIAERVNVPVAIDSGAAANVIHPKDLPADCRIEPNTTNRHFRGANNSRIERYGKPQTVLVTSTAAWAAAGEPPK